MTDQSQSDNLPAVASQAIHPDRRALMRPETDSWVAVVQQIANLSKEISDTAFVPKGVRGSAPATAAAILYGREIGLPPMTALSSVFIVDGTPTMRAETMRAMVFQAGHEIQVTESTGAICTIRGKRKGWDDWSAPVSWTVDMARAAKLTGKDNWTKYPRAMLLARATAELCRIVFPDIIHGMRATEEITDDPGELELTGAGPDTGPARTTKVTRRALPPAATSTPDGAAPPPAAASRGGADAPPAPDPGPDAAIATSAPPLPSLPGEDGYGDAGADRAGSAPAPPTIGAEGPGPAAGDSSAGPGSSPDGLVGPEELDEHNQERFQEPADPTAPTGHTGPEPASRGRLRALHGQFTTLGFTKSDDDRAARIAITRAISGEDITSSENLTHAGAGRVADTLAKFRTRADLTAFLEAMARRDDGTVELKALAAAAAYQSAETPAEETTDDRDDTDPGDRPG